MQWFNNLKVGKKILLSSTVFVLLITGISIQGLLFNSTTIGAFTKLYDQEFMPVMQLDTIMKNLLQLRINMLIQYQASMSGDWAEVSNREGQNKKLIDEYLENFKKYRATLFSEEGRKLAGEWESASVAPGQSRKLFTESLYEKRFDDAAKHMDQWAVEYRALHDKTEEMIASKTRFAEADKNAMVSDAQNSLAATIIILVFSFIAAAAITIVLARSVSGPVNKGLAFAGRIAEGDLTGRIDVDRDDELGMLGKSLNRAADSLAALISNVISASQNLAQAVEQITSGNQNLSQRTSEQASSLEEIASTIEQATAAINQNADNAADARKLSATSSKMAEEGGRLVSDAVASINEINSTSKKIGEIISVINEITFQTNLLALNASVEAARAGEQGRGFAVVAGEVRNLAQRSGGAAKEITELIKGSLDMIETGTQKANRSSDALKKIIESINNVDSVIGEIAEATKEQKAGITQINLAVSEMDSMTQQNAALVEETSSASESMAGQAQELLAMVGQFRISDGGRQETAKKTIQEKSPVPMKRYTARTSEKIKKVPEKTEQGFALTELKPGPGPDAISTPVEKAAPAAKPAPTAKPKPAPGPVDSTDKALIDDGFEKF